MASDESQQDTHRLASKLFDRARSLADVAGTDVHIVELLRVYVNFEPRNGLAWFHLGDALRSLGRLKEGRDALLQALSFAPSTSRFAVYARLGMLEAKATSPSEGEKWYRLATAEAGCPGWMWCLRGSNLLRMEAYGLAKTCLEAALKSEDVVREEVLLNLALMARAQQRYADAREFLQEALTIDPQYEDAKAVMASLADVERTITDAAAVVAQLSGDGK
jgi:tetratricopeptide (TPR) repeat protein